MRRWKAITFMNLVMYHVLCFGLFKDIKLRKITIYLVIGIKQKKSKSTDCYLLFIDYILIGS